MSMGDKAKIQSKFHLEKAKAMEKKYRIMDVGGAIAGIGLFSIFSVHGILTNKPFIRNISILGSIGTLGGMWYFSTRFLFPYKREFRNHYYYYNMYRQNAKDFYDIEDSEHKESTKDKYETLKKKYDSLPKL